MSLTGNAKAEQTLRGKINRLDELRGYSAYELALIHGFKGTEEEWLEILGNNGYAKGVEKNLNAHTANKSNPHGVTAAQVGAVNKAGDTMTGSLSMKPIGVSAYSQIYKNATSDTSDWGTLLLDRDSAGAIYGSKVRAASKQARITDGVNEVDILHTGNYKDHALARDGSNAMTGNLTIQKSGCVNGGISTDTGAVSVHSYGEWGKGCALFIPSDLSPAGWDNLAFLKGSERHTILHTGNKPSGSYTGNGDATLREIATGGIGSVVVVWSQNGVAIITATDGAICKTGTTVTGITAAECSAVNGVIKTATTNELLNANGITYNYQVP